MIFPFASLLALVVAAPSLRPNLPTVRSSIVLHLRAPAAEALPMFDPVNEARWAPDWRPTLIGDGNVAAGLVFTTDDGRATWLLDRYDPPAGTIRYVIFGKNTLTTIDVGVVPDGASASIATVTYTRTALNESAITKVNTFARSFPDEAHHWESAINTALDAARTR